MAFATGFVPISLGSQPLIERTRGNGLDTNHPILIVLLISVVAPILAEIPLGVRVPTVVIEMVLGIVVGPHVLRWIDRVDPTSPIGLLAQAGLGFLFFVVGMEIDIARFRGRVLSLGIISWCMSLGLAVFIVGLMYMTSFFRQPALIAIALTTTSTGMLAPIFRDAGELDTNFGKLFLAAATFGEFGPIVVIVLVFTRAFSYPEQAALMLFFIVVAVVMAVAAMRVRPLGVVRPFHRTLHMSNQLPVRICMLLLTFLIVLAGAFGIDAILGAFAAGMVVGLAARGKDGELLREKIDAIAFGYFVPFFFITSGMRIDLDALRTSYIGMALTPLFLLLFLVVRGVPVFLLYRNELAREEKWPFALYLATALPLVVAITDIGVQTRNMRTEVAAALVTAAILSSLIYPTIADLLFARRTGRADIQSVESRVIDRTT